MPLEATDALPGAAAEPIALDVGPPASSTPEAGADLVAALPQPDPAPAEAPALDAEPAPAEAEAKAEPSAIEAAGEAPKDDAKPEDGEKPAEAAAPEVKPDPFAFEDWNIPEGMEAAPERIGAYNNILGKHGIPQAAGQELLDFHASAMRDYAEQMVKRQWDEFAATNQKWVKEFNRIAGNQRDTILGHANAAVRGAFTSPAEVTKAWEALKATGAGNNPYIIKLLAHYGRQASEREAPSSPLGAHLTQTPAQRRYNRQS